MATGRTAQALLSSEAYMPFYLDYFLFVFVAATGFLQLGVTRGRLRGLYFIGSRVFNFALGMFLSCIGFIGFFYSDFRNVSDTTAGLDGNQQSIIFVTATFSSLLFSLCLSSFLNRKLPESNESGYGLQILAHKTFFSAIKCTSRALWNP
ncbi:MAG: hypothetical protein CL891_02855 [Dehalococcoidia bacterium]|nr:hypothetical protein [Dehalococcoidia bacterium]